MTLPEKRKNKRYAKLFNKLALIFITLFVIDVVLVLTFKTNYPVFVFVSIILSLVLAFICGSLSTTFRMRLLKYKSSIEYYRQLFVFNMILDLVTDDITTVNITTAYKLYDECLHEKDLKSLLCGYITGIRKMSGDAESIQKANELITIMRKVYKPRLI